MAAFLLAGTTAALAQTPPDAFLNQQRQVENQVRDRLDQEMPADRQIDIDYGGWYGFHFFLYDDGVESSRTFRQHDLRVWGSASFDQGAHQIYGRLKLQYDDFNTGDSFDGNDDDWVGPNLDRATYQFDLQRALRAYAHEDIDWNFKLRAGRDLVELGTGYALSLPMDHLLLTAELGDVRVEGLAGAAIRSTKNLDRSHPNSSNSERCFWGGQVTYTGLEKHAPFVYAFWNHDQLTERPVAAYQNWDYDSYYVGMGSKGELLTNLRYLTELVFEGGTTYGNGRWLEKDDIEAWAYDIELEYLTQWPMRPRFEGEYMFASGDRDRYWSPSDSVGGNTFGDDNGFNGFGYRDTGIALAPRLSNIHIWRLGAAFTPFEEIELLRDLELGSDWFLYSKHRETGAISDFTADRRSGYLGWEMDYFATWRLTSDLSWTTRFGTFFPGRGFSDQTTRTFLYMGLTWSF